VTALVDALQSFGHRSTQCSDCSERQPVLATIPCQHRGRIESTDSTYSSFLVFAANRTVRKQSITLCHYRCWCWLQPALCVQATAPSLWDE
jgi:hypothetical protein